MEQNIKVITLWQPYASLVVIGAKSNETRSWVTKHRGPLLIHAAARFPADCMANASTEPFAEALAKAGLYVTPEPNYNSCYKHNLPLGHIIGRVELRDIERVENVRKELTPEESAFGDYSDGRFAWALENAEVFAEPIPMRGRQAVWNVDIDLSKVGLK
jgi:hypothetical protein